MSQIKDLSLTHLVTKWHNISDDINTAEVYLNRVYTEPTNEDIIDLLKVSPIVNAKSMLVRNLETLDMIEYTMSRHTAYLPILTAQNVHPRFSHFKREEA